MSPQGVMSSKQAEIM